MTDMTPETKAFASPLSNEAALDEVHRLFEHFKAENDCRLKQLETRGAADPLTDDKIARLDAALDRASRRDQAEALRHARPPLGTEEKGARTPEHKAAFARYMRAGDVPVLSYSAHAAGLDTRAMPVGSTADGGYTAPPEVETTILTRLRTLSPIRSIAGVRQISAGTYQRPFATNSAASGWVGETGARAQTNSVTLAQQVFPAMELYAMPAATQTLLDDSAVDLESWIADEVQNVFAQQEGAAFVNGDGVSKPTGFLSGTPVANASWAWGQLGYVASGAASGFAASNPSDALVDLVYALKAGYRQNAHVVMNRKTQGEIRKLKDAQGHYLWQPPAVAGGQASLMSFPVVEAEDMPDIGAGAFPIAFGDFSRGYLIVDRLGLRILRDPYSAKPYVLFYTTKRVGGGIADYDAIKLLKVGVS